MANPTLGWQSCSPPYPRWHGLPHWDYSPFPESSDPTTFTSSRPLPEPIRYWCSWYAYGTKINAKILTDTLDQINQKDLAFTHFLIDDGWCEWGDWLSPDPSKFDDLKALITRIKASGKKVGLWVAPFLADQQSQLFSHHPSYFSTYQKRLIPGLRIMPVWNNLIRQRYLLNFDLPEVRAYTKLWLKLIVEDWGIDLLKLDFLYAPYFNPNLTDPSLARSHLTFLLSYIKNTYPHLQTIACGAPFADCHQQVDAIRVSKDTALPPVGPRWFNRLIYTFRVRLLHTALQAKINPKLNLDPDVRMFTLDNYLTTRYWRDLNLPIIGIGDNLLQYDATTLERAKSWLKNHFSQS